MRCFSLATTADILPWTLQVENPFFDIPHPYIMCRHIFFHSTFAPLAQPLICSFSDMTMLCDLKMQTLSPLMFNSPCSLVHDGGMKASGMVKQTKWCHRDAMTSKTLHWHGDFSVLLYLVNNTRASNHLIYVENMSNNVHFSNRESSTETHPFNMQIPLIP